jgi:F0F1-type ATP synthase assembly protein I
MSDLTPRPRSGLSRSARERRAYQLVVAAATAGVVAIVTFVLALAGVMGFGPFVLALIVAVVCGWRFRRTVSP